MNSHKDTAKTRRVFVVGNGMTRFLRPGKHKLDYTDLASIAVQRAIDDSKLDRKAVEQIVIGYVYGDSCSGQKAAYAAGMLTGVPIMNVNNNCSTGSTAIFMAHNMIKGCMADCVMALGFEKMYSGSLKSFFSDRVNPLSDFIIQNAQMRGMESAPIAPQLFGNAGREHMEKYGTKEEHFGKVAEKNHRHSVNNPYSQFRDVYSLK